MVSVPTSTLPSPAAPLPGNGARDYYSIAQAAELLGVSRVSIWRWIRAGHLPASRVGPRTTRIARVDLERLTAERGAVVPLASAVAGPGAGMVVDAPEAVDWRAIGPSEHVVQFYDADGPLLDAVGGFIAAAIHAGDVGIVIVTEAHREAIEQRLRDDCLDVAMARDRGHYLALDAAEMLSSFMVDGTPDPARFTETLDGVIPRAVAGGRRVHVFGEMVALLALEGNHAAAVQLEALWNDLQARLPLALFCAYPMACLGGSSLAGVFGEVCAEHGRVIPTESYTALSTPDDRFRAIVQWQQKAQSLEAALASEFAARRAAEDALRVRDEFLSIASHELRTPLTAISGYTQVVLRQLERDGQLQPERFAQSLQTIRGQAGKLSRLITQLLDVSRLETEKLSLERVPTDLTDLVEQTVAVVRVVGGQHRITVEAPSSLEALVDPLRLEQVLTNLLDNAVKYSPEESEVEVVLRRDGADALELAVRDHGPGIPAEKRDQLFERFYQAHASGHHGGMGLGLYISREIVELHGGTIRAEFPSDGGSRFVVRLPVG